MYWSQTYTANFSGALNADGSFTVRGTLKGTDASVYRNCTHDGAPSSCPKVSGRYEFPITVTGKIDKAGRTGKGTVTVNHISLPTAGDWSAG